MTFSFFFSLVDYTTISANLATQANLRLRQAYTSKTWAKYQSMFFVFLTFCCQIGVDVIEVNEQHAIMFMEYLANKNLAVSSIRNYVSAVVMYFKWFSLQFEIFSHHKVTMMFKALERSIKRTPKFKGIFHLQDLGNILQLCDNFPLSQMYKCLYLLAYFGFLRISNLVPSSFKKFSISKHLCRADILVQNTDMIVIVKWSKTLQATNQGSYIVLPRLENQLLCPCKNFERMHSAFPTLPNAPCFSSKKLCITEYMVRKHLKNILNSLGLDTDIFSFHTFRRSGATLAYNLDVSLESIRRHGTWKSDAVNTYIVDDPHKATGVARAFQTSINSV